MPSVGSRALDAGRDAPADAPAQIEPARRRGGLRRHGAVLLPWLAVGPAVAVAAWLLVSLPLVLVGRFYPVPAVVAFVPVVVALSRWTARLLPALEAPVWSPLLVVAVAVGFTALAVAGHAEQVVVRRDPGSYAQFTYWLSRHGSLPVPAHLSDFGGAAPTLTVDSPGFFQRGGTVVPQFMAGFPLTATVGAWVGGWTGLLISPALFGGFATLAMGGLTARLVGPRWAPLGALTLAAAFPMLYVSRATYSEPLGLLLTLAGMYLLTYVADRGVDRRLAALAGLLLGLVLLVRVDAGREIALLVPVLGWLAAGRRARDPARARGAVPLAAGLALGAAYGIVDGAVLSRPYMNLIRSSVTGMVAFFVGMVAATLCALVLARRAPPLPGRRARGLPAAAAAAVGLAAVFLVVRPHVQTVHGIADPSSQQWLVALQRSLRLPVDGSRRYDETSLHWVAWYLGWPLLALALGGTVLLTYRTLRGGERGWVGPLPVIVGSSVLVLWRPGILPDHPWASRRLVVTVIPGCILMALWLAARLTAALRRRSPGRARRTAAPVAAAVVVALAVVPAALACAPLALARTEVGEVDVVRQACQQFRDGDVALMVDARGRREWSQVLRGGCDVPTAGIVDVTPAGVRAAVSRVEAAGHTVVLAATDPGVLLDLGLRAHQAVSLHTREDTHELLRPADRTNPLVVTLWVAPAPDGPPEDGADR